MKGSHCGEHCWQEGKYMKNFQIGKSGIEVPFLGMGTWAIGGGAWWGDNDDSLSVKAIQTAVEQGSGGSTPHPSTACTTAKKWWAKP